MGISNPCSWFSGGGSSEDIKEFTYEGGKYLYHFDCSGGRDDIRTGWTGNWIPVNVVFFANSPEHAGDIFRRMLEFYIDCAHKQTEYYGSIRSQHWKEDLERTNSRYKMAREWLAKVDEAIFTLAPTNQFFKVGWACNDTIL